MGHLVGHSMLVVLRQKSPLELLPLSFTQTKQTQPLD